MSRPDPAGLLDLASSAALAAARLLGSQRGRPEVVQTKSSPTDVVTRMDRAAEELIRSRILAERPGDAILGEEGGQVGGAAGSREGPEGPAGSGGPEGTADGPGARVRWIVDPLDGTVNYLYGLPDWSVSIAAELDGRVSAGVVCVPRRAAMYTAVLGGGAWLRPLDGGEPRRLRCNAGVPLAEALIATGFGYAAARRRVQGRVVSAVLPAVRDIRRGGSCAVDLCSLASGQVDGYYERGAQYWDIAAGGLVAAEAGASVAGLAGRPAGPSMTVAAGSGLFGELHDLLVSLDPERDD